MNSRTVFRRAASALSCGLCLSHGAVYAVDPPDAGAVHRLEREQLERLLQERRLLQQPVQPEISVPSAPAPSEASRVRNIPVKSFELNESAILSAGEIRAVLAPYEGKTLSLADLFEAVAGLNKLYADKNMPTARALLPPQEIRDGVVKIRLVEARVGAIKVGQVSQVSPEFIQQRLTLVSGELMSVSRLESDLQRFNRLHEVQLRASVQPGLKTGETDIQLEAAEPKRYQYSLFADNAGRYTVGEERVGLTARVAGLTGRGDSLMFTGTLAEGADSYALAYALPLNPDDLKLDIAYSQGGIKVVDGGFVPLDVSGTSSDFSVGLSQPVLVDAQRLWSLYGRMAVKESVSKFGGAEQLNMDLTVLTAGASGEYQSDSSSWNLDVNLNQGLRGLGSESSFTALRANAAWLKRLNLRAQSILRGGLQISPTSLIPASEQFQLGGGSSVRGYSEGLLSGRNGYLISGELRYALQNPEDYLTRSPNTPLLTGFVFLDHGGAFPYRPRPLKDATGDDYLTGAGVGLLVDWKSRVSGRLAVGWPLRQNAAEAVEREPRLHAFVSISF